SPSVKAAAPSAPASSRKSSSDFGSIALRGDALIRHPLKGLDSQSARHYPARLQGFLDGCFGARLL
ncbi:hypothetical protein, partial [Salipiger profundus]|uniref:hypothetical protein n=1 Tax=Salipiger profundus TaxID=1229727 RepID=UPI001E4C31F1